MKNTGHLTLAYLRLIRWPNIIIIIMTQLLLRYAVIAVIYSYSGAEPALDNFLFALLVFITVVIAAAGYVINDYFDLQTDQINRPATLVVGKYLHRRKAIQLHMVLNGVAVVLGFYLAYRVGSIRLGLIFPMIILLLWLYSERYKRMVLVGNLTVAFLSAMVSMVVWLFEFFAVRLQPDIFMKVYMNLSLISQIVFSFTVFAFLLTLVREIVKDAEDVAGDSQTDCYTIPVVYGIPVTRRVASSLLGLTMLLVAGGSWKLYGLSLPVPAFYFAFVVGLPVLFAIFKIAVSRQASDFSLASKFLKFIMLAGILGMIPLACYL